MRRTRLGLSKHRLGHRLDSIAKRVLDVSMAAALLVLALPVGVILALAIKLDSPGPVFYRCRRVGRAGSEFAMLKFRKMWDGAHGPALTTAVDERLTRVGRFLAASKLDELPQLWNVIKGEMSLVGPRPEDPTFVNLAPETYREILRVRPGITGLSQLAFARESEILEAGDRVGHYLAAIFPQKLALDMVYVSRRSVGMDLMILFWTARATLAGREVAVNRANGKLTRRHPRELPQVAVGHSEVA
jgi:lipopolysaccharide/colanic/teichoic acid biosynthesis glycosyltransferase